MPRPDHVIYKLIHIGQRPRVRRPLNSEYDDRFLAPSFKGERTSVMFWDAVGYKTHSELVAVQRRDPKERTHDKDKLGMNSQQYCQEILKEHLLPMVAANPGVEVIEDGAPIHNSKAT